MNEHPDAPGIRAVWRGHAPNCSSSGSVVGMALVSAVATAAIVNAWAARFLRWKKGEAPGGDNTPDGGSPPDPGTPPDAGSPPTTDNPAATGSPPDKPRLRPEADGSALLHFPPGAADDPGGILVLDPGLAADAAAAPRPPTIVGHAAPARVSGALRAPTEVHVAVTTRCPVACTACYLDAGPDRPGPEPGAAELKAHLAELAAMGVFEVAFGGGEGLLRDDLLDLARHARDLGLTPNLTTSGFGLTPTRARQLAEVMGQVNISIDGLGQTYRDARGWDGAERGLAAVALLHDAGARVGVNTLLSRPLLDRPGALEDLGRAIAAAGAREWQWLRLKPAGRGVDAYADLALRPDQHLDLWPRALALDAALDLVLRFDCALVPFLAAHDPPPELLARLGVRGCPGGHSLWARAADGAWAPCSFAPATSVAPHASDGLPAAWSTDPQLRAWRDRATTPPAPCNTCAYASTCRGGCRIVAGHHTGDPLAPDPECPRVIAHAARLDAPPAHA